MVNYGVSGACRTCKTRRKKCDEARPSCQRCIKASRTCYGYQDSTDLHFRRYRGTANTCSSDLESENPPSRSLPSPPGSYFEDAIDARIEELALAAFLDDYCFLPEHGLHAHGYLGGLEMLLNQSGSSSDLAQAAKTVALASSGTKLGRSALVHKAREMYSEMLQSIQKIILNGAMTNTAESLMTVVLLGMYEMIIATEIHPSNHGSHSCGIYAILSTKSSPHDLLYSINNHGISKTLLPNGLLKTSNIYGAPTSDQSQNLDALIIKFLPLLKAAGIVLSSKATLVEDLHQTLATARTFNEEYSRWPKSVLESWKPTTIGYLNHGQMRFARSLSWLPRRIDAYLDIYVATVWNTYRKTRLMLLSIIIRCLERLDMKKTYHDEKIQIEELVNDMASSIPFHLFGDIANFMERANSNPGLTIVPGKSVGGLLLMHPLAVTLNMPIIESQLQFHMRECLAWIGTNMGIGQATVMATTSATFPNESIANGYTLLMAGMSFTKSDNPENTGSVHQQALQV